MAVEPFIPAGELHGLALTPFRAAWADVVAGWVRTPQDAFWLAPRTAPPITGEKVRGWSARGREQFVLRSNPAGPTAAAAEAPPLAYGELNLLNPQRRSFWLGHLIVDPEQRGRGLGKELTRRLVERGLRVHRARSIALVVFEENSAAVAAYRAAGLREECYEEHYLPPYHCTRRLLRMTLTD